MKSRFGLRRVGCLLVTGLAVVSCKPRSSGSKVLDGEQLAAVSGPAAAYQGPERFLSAEVNQVEWAKYCKGSADVAAPVNPEYSNAQVQGAFSVLTQVSSHSFKLYRDIMKMHQTSTPAGLGAGLAHLASVSTTERKNRVAFAHNFLTYLCGEFRDRATMIEAKLRWVQSMNYLQKATAARQPFNPQLSPWAQMSLEDYEPFVALSGRYFDAKAIGPDGGVKTMNIGDQEVEEPVPGMTGCEVKFMFSEFVRKGRTWQSLGQGALARFQGEYQAFRGSCAQGDEDYYYDFRGDSNYKPNSPESNGMIWASQIMAKNCVDRATAKPNRRIKNADCKRYYENPFRSRWNAARAGLSAWLLRDQNMDYLSSPEEELTVLLNSSGTDGYLFGDVGPWQFRSGDQAGGLLNGWQTYWQESDFGLIKLAEGNGLPAERHKEFIFSRLSAAVDRHTNWYASRFDDLHTQTPFRKDQAYSPFVASSYEISKSDGFTFPGATIPVENGNDCCRHWMFIFKVQRANWYNPRRLVDEPQITLNFEKMWFDETSFGFDGLANEERAWDRLGSPTEDEHAEILYLHNLKPAGF